MVVFALIQIDNILSNSKMTSEIYAEILRTSVFLNPTTMTKLHIFWVSPQPGQTETDIYQFWGIVLSLKLIYHAYLKKVKIKTLMSKQHWHLMFKNQNGASRYQCKEWETGLVSVLNWLGVPSVGYRANDVTQKRKYFHFVFPLSAVLMVYGFWKCERNFIVVYNSAKPNMCWTVFLVQIFLHLF